MQSEHSKKVAVLTLGCRTNQSESSIIEGTLKENGVTIVNLSEKPDFCVVNTCTVTSKGDYNSRQMIRRAARSGAKVIVTGCYADLNRQSVIKMDGVSEVIKNSNKMNIAGIIIGQATAPYFGSYSCSRPHLKVQDGCNFACSYCAVPAARGKSHSIHPDEVLKRAELIESLGFREIVLTGIHLGTYGRDLSKPTSISALIRDLLNKTKRLRIRLSSIEVNELDEEMLDLLQCDRLCNHLHIPLQSGSDVVLQKMRRNYSVGSFEKKVLEVASRVDNIAIGSDVIIGFPGEGISEFNETFNLLERLPFSYLHAFPFSSRQGTPAASMPDAPDPRTVKDRMQSILQLGSRKSENYRRAQIGRILEVVTEQRTPEGWAVGTAANYLKVQTCIQDYQRGSLVPVRVNDVSDDAIRGTIINSL